MEKSCWSCKWYKVSGSSSSDYCGNCLYYGKWEPITLNIQQPIPICVNTPEEFKKVQDEIRKHMQDNKRPTPSYYNYSYKGIKLDPYRLAEIYGIIDNRQFHMFKKCVRMHKENHKDLKTNLTDIIKTAQRWLEMLEEDK